MYVDGCTCRWGFPTYGRAESRLVLIFYSLLPPLLPLSHPPLLSSYSYVGRKALNWEKEKLIDGAKKLVIPHYSYWTLGYLLSNTGARKLLEAQPFNSLLPVDEYLPIMFNTHPEYVHMCMHAR